MIGQARVAVTAGGPAAVLELPWESAVAEILTQAVAQLGLEGDWQLYCEDGTTMMNKLHRTLDELRARRICPRLEFELRPPERPPTA